jgi:hypothetical protein
MARIVALEALHVGDGHAAGEKRILAPRLVVATPVGVAPDVDDGGAVDEPLVFAGGVGIEVPAVVDGARLVGERVGDAADEGGVSRRRHGYTSGEQGGRPVLFHAVEALVPLVRADAEPLDRGAAVVEEDRFLLKRESPDEVVEPLLRREGSVAEGQRRFGGGERLGGGDEEQRGEAGKFHNVAKFSFAQPHGISLSTHDTRRQTCSSPAVGHPPPAQPSKWPAIVSRQNGCLRIVCFSSIGELFTLL